MLPSEIKDVEFKLGKLLFIPGEHKILPSEIILFWMNKNFTIQTKRCRIQNWASYFLFRMNKKFYHSE